MRANNVSCLLQDAAAAPESETQLMEAFDSAEIPGAAAVPESEENVWWRENSDELIDAEQQASSPSRLRTRDQEDVQEMNEEATSPIAAPSPPSQPMAMCTITSPKGSPGRSICHDASPPRPQHAAAGMKRPLEAAGNRSKYLWYCFN